MSLSLPVLKVEAYDLSDKVVVRMKRLTVCKMPRVVPDRVGIQAALMPGHPSPAAGVVWEGQGEASPLGHGLPTHGVLCGSPLLLLWCWRLQGKDGCSDAVTPAPLEPLWSPREVRQGLGCPQTRSVWLWTLSIETQSCERCAGKSGSKFPSCTCGAVPSGDLGRETVGKRTWGNGWSEAHGHRQRWPRGRDLPSLPASCARPSACATHTGRGGVP